MSQEDGRAPIAKLKVLFEQPGMGDVSVERNRPYGTAEDEALLVDVYRPLGAARPLPVVFFVTGYSDRGMRAMLGCNAKDMESYVSWARLVAGCGLAALLCTVRDPVRDVRDALAFARTHAVELGLDSDRIGLWSCSGHGPNALALLMDEGKSVACAAFSYAYTLDFEDSNAVAEASKTFRFSNPCAGRSMDALPSSVPIFVARAGRDETPGLNASLDRFVAAALARNLPMTLVNHHSGPHAFDLVDPSEETRGVVAALLAFLKRHLALESARSRSASME